MPAYRYNASHRKLTAVTTDREEQSLIPHRSSVTENAKHIGISLDPDIQLQVRDSRVQSVMAALCIGSDQRPCCAIPIEPFCSSFVPNFG